ncbi:MAG TPA: PLP-dependent aminotransferase family protein [Blastocatellia bacterium]|nr:PLP-dependent aminotransferase family protein [Blastocatellia bacterium]
MDIAINLDSRSRSPLHRQLYEELRRAILSGRLSPGQRIPSTRALAERLGISRATVTQSYDELLSEGYLQAAHGSGTFISHHLPEELLRTRPARASAESPRRAAAHVKLSSFGESISRTWLDRQKEFEGAISFRHWRPDFDGYPSKEWGRLLARQCRTAPRAMFDYDSSSQGHHRLREAITSYLGRSRAVTCDPDQVIVVSGSQQAIDLITRVVIDRGDRVAVEDPGYLGARQIFLAHEAKLLPVPVDGAGAQVERLSKRAGAKVKLVYVTPSHQFPTGALLSLARRLELIRWAGERGALIIEDDYDSEYRYCGRPVPALQGLDPSGSVVYVGTFSKVLFPALRIGYMVAPRSMVEVLARAKWLTDRQAPTLEQYALADFINEGHLERHIRRMRTLYDRRRAALVRALTNSFGDRVEILGEDAGMHLMARFRTKMSDEQIVERAAGAGVGVATASRYYIEAGERGEFIFGYADLSERRIQEGIRRLVRVLNQSA